METEFGGDPVAGGTLPTLIWKEFQAQALALQGGLGEHFDGDSYIPSTWKRIVNRGGWKLDNGYCPNTRLVASSRGAGRPSSRTASRTRFACRPSSARRSSRPGALAAKPPGRH